MSTSVRIINGTYKGTTVSDKIFTVHGRVESSRDGSLKLINDGQIDTDKKYVSIKVREGDYEVVSTGRKQRSVPVTFSTKEKSQVEDDESIMNRIAEQFETKDALTAACIGGDIRAMIVVGEPGTGKSYGIEQQLEKYSLFDQLGDKKIRYGIVKGAMSGVVMFSTLFKYADAGNVVVFDDCDVWEDQDAMNILKGALDTGENRRISWNKDSRYLRANGIPNSFNFNGSIIFITNLKFSERGSAKIKAHLDALQDRCHFVDIDIKTQREKLLRIKQVHRDSDGGLFSKYDFENGEGEQIFKFMWANKDKFRNLSLRTCIKIADLVKAFPNDWQVKARHTCMIR